jgi:Raf kinase inhibitor-like YbhB/YbcL family protein
MAQQLNIQDLTIESSAFENHSRMPDRHTTEGEDVSPELVWSGTPEGTKSIALVAHDPDAPLVDGFTHWVAFNFPGDSTGVGEASSGVTNGRNSAGQNSYMGPAPPPGHGTHHYYFWVYALDEDLDLEPGLTRSELIARIEDHVIEQARIVGTYSR